MSIPTVGSLSIPEAQWLERDARPLHARDTSHSVNRLQGPTGALQGPLQGPSIGPYKGPSRGPYRAL